MKKAIIILSGIILLFGQSIHAQHSGISITGGLGQYQLTALTVYQNEIMDQLPVEMQVLSSFPPYTSMRISYTNQNMQGLKYEFVYAYSTTGIHSNYSDFSGYVNLDQIVTAYQFGVGAAYRLVYLNGMEIMAYGDFRLAYVQDRVNMNIVTSYYYENRNLKLRKISPFAEAGLEILKHFNSFSLGLQGGYCQDIIGKFRVTGESQSTDNILYPAGDVSSRMSGFRGGVKFILWFNSSPGIKFSL